VIEQYEVQDWQKVKALRQMAIVDWPVWTGPPGRTIKVAGYRPGWDHYFLDIAKAVSARSDCERDKVGAVVVNNRRIRSTGYNGAPSGQPGCVTCPRRSSGCEPGSDYSNCVAVHAEANALLYADREDLIGATLYITRKPCYACEKLIQAAGIVNVITPEDL
jgi:dCMP deaminase